MKNSVIGKRAVFGDTRIPAAPAAGHSIASGSAGGVYPEQIKEETNGDLREEFELLRKNEKIKRSGLPAGF
jgi:hypothetical protein